MKINFKKNLLAACVMAATATSVNVQAAAKDTTVDVSFRYRIETVDLDSATTNTDAEASTLRTRATIKTNWTSKVDTVLEFDDVSIIGMDDYNPFPGTASSHAVVADPEGTEVNQSFIRYNGEKTKAAFGRQRILVGNQRFVGGVGWRQNEQTYDSLTLKNKFSDNVSFDYAYVFNVNRIFGETVAGGDHTHNTHLMNLDYKMGDHKLSGYYFKIDNESAAGLSNNTFGVRYAGKFGGFGLNAEYASQSDGADNPTDYSANYYLLEGSYKLNNFGFGLGLEVLGGDAYYDENNEMQGQGFTTSLATLHKFQGWADKFLATPKNGIEDLYINASYKAGGFNFKAIYHDFEADQFGGDLGSEIDFVVTKKFADNFSGMLKFASYSAPTGGTDIDKMWLMLSYNL